MVENRKHFWSTECFLHRSIFNEISLNFEHYKWSSLQKLQIDWFSYYTYTDQCLAKWLEYINILQGLQMVCVWHANI